MRSFRVASGQTGFPSQFDSLRHDARGGSFLLAHQQLGSFNLSTNPSNGQTLTLTVNGTPIVLTFISSTLGSAPGNILIQSTAALTAAAVLALLNQPQTTTSSGVALSAANQQLLSYLSYSLNGTTLAISSNNNSVNAPLTSLSASTTATGDSWTGNTMALYVQPGVAYVNGTRVIFNGGSSPTITAPVSNPRIDLLTLDNTGALALTTGTENATPSAPTYPADKIVLCEIYNVVGETALYDSENQQSGQGYVYHDVRPLLGQQANFAALLDSIIPAANNTYDLGSSSFNWNNVYVNNLRAVNLFGNGAGITGFPAMGMLATLGAPVTVSSSTAETTVLSASVPGGTLGTGNAIYGRIYFHNLRLTSGKTATIRIKYGGTTMITVVLTGNQSGQTDNIGGVLDFVIVANAATNAQAADLSFIASENTGAISIGTSTTGLLWMTSATGSAAVDSTAAQTVAATIQFNNSSSVDTISADTGYIHSIK